MPSIINSDNGSVSGSAGLKFTSADDGVLQIQNNGNTAVSISSAGQATFNTPVSQPGAFMFRNKIINGNFDIWQRGTSQTSSGYGSADRWFCQNSGSTKTASQQAFALGQTDVPNNPKYFMRHVVTSSAGASSRVNIDQRIESAETLAGQTATLSFWAKADASKNIAVEFAQYFGSGGSPSAFNSFSSQLVALTTSWTKYTVTVNIPSVSGKTLGTAGNDYLYFTFWFDAGSDFDARTASLGQQSGTFDIAQVQIEEGTAATPFEMRPYGMELSLCQRYYLHQMATNATGYATGVGQTARCGTQVNFPVALRTSSWSASYIRNQSGAVNNTPNYSVSTIYGTSIYWTATGAGSTWWSGTTYYDAEL